MSHLVTETPIEIDYAQIKSVALANIDHADYPDFCDAYIESCTYQGREATEAELDEINTNREYVYQCVIERLF